MDATVSYGSITNFMISACGPTLGTYYIKIKYLSSIFLICIVEPKYCQCFDFHALIY